MDTTNTKYRIRQCSKCPGDLKYFCVTCFCNLCSECVEFNLVGNSRNDPHNVILYREKFNYIKKHEICARHPINVYKKYCKLCTIPICTDCTEHRTHRKTDVETAYKARGQKRKIIKEILSETLPLCSALLFDITINFKTVSSDIANFNPDRQTEKIRDCLDDVLCGFQFENRCFKHKIGIKKYIVRTQIYELLYEHSSNDPIKFLLSGKKHPPNCKTFKKYGQPTLTKSLHAETLIKKLLTIKLSNKGKRPTETEELYQRMDDQFTKMMEDPSSMMAFIKVCPMLFSQYPMNIMKQFGLANFFDQLQPLVETFSLQGAEGNITIPDNFLDPLKPLVDTLSALVDNTYRQAEERNFRTPEGTITIPANYFDQLHLLVDNLYSEEAEGNFTIPDLD